MNAAHMNPSPSNPQESLSALADGELDVAALGGLFADMGAEPETMERWHAYQVIGDVLRGSDAIVSARKPGDFLVGLRERLESEVGVVSLPSAGSRIESVPAAAANDAVFRWKMVAGFASFAAVMAVSWSLVGNAPQGAGGGSGPQLAGNVPAPNSPGAAVPVASVTPASPSAEVVVNTGQGVVIRDARLEELLAEHRQHGGMSALQMPTGFIRGATYDASER